MTESPPLQGVKVIEVGNSIAAPYASFILSELGAEVIKVETPNGGDPARNWGKPEHNGASYTFYSINRGKSGIELNLSKLDERRTLEDLIAGSDVLVTNLRARSLEKLDLSLDHLSQLNSNLVFCRISAYGAVGPLQHEPGYDILMQAASGLMSINGEPDGPPTRVPLSLIDMSTGLWSVIGILAALKKRETSKAIQLVDASLFETSLAAMAMPITAYLWSGELPKRRGSVSSQTAPFQPYRTADGWIMIAVGTDAMFIRFCDALGLSELKNDSCLKTNSDRLSNLEYLNSFIEPLLRSMPAQIIADKLRNVGVPYGPINTLAGTIANAQTKALGIISSGIEGVPSLGIPLSFNRQRPRANGEIPQFERTETE